MKKLILTAFALAMTAASYGTVMSVPTRPAGVTGTVQYNNGGVFGSSPTFTYDKVNNAVTVSTINVTFINGSTATLHQIRWADGTTQVTSGASGQYVNLGATLQSGATFYTSSGTVVAMNVTTLKFADGTSQTTAGGGGGGGNFWIGTATSALNMGGLYSVYGATNIVTSSMSVTGGTMTVNGVTYNPPALSQFTTSQQLITYSKVGGNMVGTPSNVILDAMRLSSTDTVTASKAFQQMVTLPTAAQAGQPSSTGQIVIDTGAFTTQGSSGTIVFYSGSQKYYVVATTGPPPNNWIPKYNATTNRWEVAVDSGTSGGGGSGTPGGSDTQLQFNSASSFGGVSVATFNSTSNLITLSSAVTHVNIASETLTNTNLVLDVNSYLTVLSSETVNGPVAQSFSWGSANTIASRWENLSSFNASNKLRLAYRAYLNDGSIQSLAGFDYRQNFAGGLDTGELRLLVRPSGAPTDLLVPKVRIYTDSSNVSRIDFGTLNSIDGSGASTNNSILRSIGNGGTVDLTNTSGKLVAASVGTGTLPSDVIASSVSANAIQTAITAGTNITLTNTANGLSIASSGGGGGGGGFWIATATAPLNMNGYAIYGSTNISAAAFVTTGTYTAGTGANVITTAAGLLKTDLLDKQVSLSTDTTGTLSGSSVSGGTFGAVNGSALTNLTAANILAGTLGGSVIASSEAASSVGTSQIAANAVTAALIANNTITNTQISAGTFSNITVPAANVAAGSLGSSVIASSLAVVATAGSYGSATICPTITINAQGQVVSLSSNTISGGGGGDNLGNHVATKTVTALVGGIATSTMSVTGDITMSTGSILNVSSISWADSGAGWVIKASTHSQLVAGFTMTGPSSVTIQGLQFMTVANATYSFVCDIAFRNSSSNAAGWKFTLTGPAAPANVQWFLQGGSASASTSQASQSGSGFDSLNGTAMGVGSSQTFNEHMFGQLIMGPNGGPVNVQIVPATFVGAGSNSMQAGSQITAWKD